MKSPNEEGREEGRKGDRERRKCEWGEKEEIRFNDMLGRST